MGLGLRMVFVRLCRNMQPTLSRVLRVTGAVARIVSRILATMFNGNTGDTGRVSSCVGSARRSTRGTNGSATSFSGMRALDTGGNGDSDKDASFRNASVGAGASRRLAGVTAVSKVMVLKLNLVLLLANAGVPLKLFLVIANNLAICGAVGRGCKGVSTRTRERLMDVVTVTNNLVLTLNVVLMYYNIVPLNVKVVITNTTLLMDTFTVSPSSVISAVQGVLGSVAGVTVDFMG